MSEAPTQLLAECLIPPGFVNSSGLRNVVIGGGTSPQLSPTAAAGRGSWSATSSATAGEELNVETYLLSRLPNCMDSHKRFVAHVGHIKGVDAMELTHSIQFVLYCSFRSMLRAVMHQGLVFIKHFLRDVRCSKSSIEMNRMLSGDGWRADSLEEGYLPLQTRVRQAPKVKRTAARQAALIEPPDRGRPWDEVRRSVNWETAPGFCRALFASIMYGNSLSTGAGYRDKCNTGTEYGYIVVLIDFISV